MVGRKPSDAFMMPSRVRVMARSSSINNSFANGIVPEFKPTEEEILDALDTLGMTPDTVCCAYCGDACTQWDHLNPLVSGTMPTGYVTEIRNLVPCCGTCNQSKGNKSWKEWILSDSPKSPKSRGIQGIQDRMKRLEEYERKFKPMRLDIEAIVGEELWEAHWKNRDAVLNAMRQSMQVSNEIERRLVEYCAQLPNETENREAEEPESHVRILIDRPAVQKHSVKQTSDVRKSKAPISDIVKSRLIPALVRGAISAAEVERLQLHDYAHAELGLSFPLIKPLSFAEDPSEASKDENGYGRYYVRPIVIHGNRYLVCSQWYERHRNVLEAWLEAHGIP